MKKVVREERKKKQKDRKNIENLKERELIFPKARRRNLKFVTRFCLLENCQTDQILLRARSSIKANSYIKHLN